MASSAAAVDDMSLEGREGEKGEGEKKKKKKRGGAVSHPSDICGCDGLTRLFCMASTCIFAFFSWIWASLLSSLHSIFTVTVCINQANKAKKQAEMVLNPDVTIVKQMRAKRKYVHHISLTTSSSKACHFDFLDF